MQLCIRVDIHVVINCTNFYFDVGSGGVIFSILSLHQTQNMANIWLEWIFNLVDIIHCNYQKKHNIVLSHLPAHCVLHETVGQVASNIWPFRCHRKKDAFSCCIVRFFTKFFSLWLKILVDVLVLLQYKKPSEN